MLTISVKEMQFYTTGSAANEASGSADDTSNSQGQGASLSISGQVTVENDFVKMGAHHTLDLELNKDVRIVKAEWDSVAFQRVQEACSEQQGAEVGAIICGEGAFDCDVTLIVMNTDLHIGSAFFLLLSNHMTVPQQRINVPIPRKRPGSTSMHEKGLAKFYEAVYQALLRNTPYNTLRAIIVASPGFINEEIIKYIFDQAAKTNNKALLQARRKFMKVHVSSPHVHSLMEVMQSPEVSPKHCRHSSLSRAWHLPAPNQIASQLKETKFAREGIMLDKLSFIVQSLYDVRRPATLSMSILCVFSILLDFTKCSASTKCELGMVLIMWL
jgi:protein pelota